MYANARNTRLTSGFTTSDTSADSELVSSITLLRSRSRALVRDSSYAKRAKTVIVNNVIGSGIGMQAQVLTTRDELNERVNDDIEAAWCEWSEAENCHTGGRLSFESLERALMAQVFEAGEVYVRMHMRSFGSFELPFALELIEAERLADDMTIGTMAIAPGNHFRLGIECDRVLPARRVLLPQAPQAASCASPTTARTPSSAFRPIRSFRWRSIDRWPQSRGEPWMHTAATRLNDMDGYSEAEIMRARSAGRAHGHHRDAGRFREHGRRAGRRLFEATLEPNTDPAPQPGREVGRLRADSAESER
jgi:lambda family phage portal protein